MIEFYPLSWEYWDRWAWAGVVFLFDCLILALALNVILKIKGIKNIREFLMRLWKK